MDKKNKVNLLRVWFAGNNDINNPDIEYENVYVDTNKVGLLIEAHGEAVNIKKEMGIFTFIPLTNINRVERRKIDN